MAGSADSALGQLGINLDANDASAQYDEGVEVATQDGRAVYAKAAAATTVGKLVKIAPSSAGATTSCVATLVSTGTARTAAGYFAVAQTSVAANQFGWFYTAARKDAVLAVAAGCQPNVPLYTTATGGVVDDATVSLGRLDGLRILTSASAASTPAAVFHDIIIDHEPA